jgi:hypothetical protein
MNTSIIKKETTGQNNQTEVKISRRLTGNINSRKNDLVIMLREENDSLYEEYREVIKRNIELRAIVEKQQKLINAIYNAELNLVFPAEEKNTAEEIKIEPVQLESVEQPANMLPVPVATEAEKPEIKSPQPLGQDDLARRIRSLRRNKLQSQPTVIEKAKFLLAIYNTPGGIRNNILFADCGITRVTGMRYVSFFRKFSMVSSGGTYSITGLGKKFVEGEPNPEWDKCGIKKWKPIGEGNV